MIVIVCEFKIRIYEAFSLKDKRQIIKSIIERLKKFNISICEFGYNDEINLSQIGIAFVTNSKRHAESTMQNIINYLDRDTRIEILEIEREIV
ncbi:MAG: DUF503 domain-containing protein [Tissierellia bacterium]|nr:DUF503 domain-containing protein [Tissierellia bacterium]